MKGAAGELWAKIIRIARSMSMIIIGIIHHKRSFQKKANSSLMMEYLFIKFLNILVLSYHILV